MKYTLTIVFFIIIYCKSFSQSSFSYTEIDSLVSLTINSKNYLKIVDTGNLNFEFTSGSFRDLFIIDTSTNELKAFVGSVTLFNKRSSAVEAYYFHNSHLIKVEIFNNAGYHRYNSKYIYYIKDPKEDVDFFDTNNIQRLKYLRLAEQYKEKYFSLMSSKRD